MLKLSFSYSHSFVQFFRKQTRKSVSEFKKALSLVRSFLFCCQIYFPVWIRDDQNESWYGHWFHQSRLLELLSFWGLSLFPVQCSKWNDGNGKMRERVNVFVFFFFIFFILNLSLCLYRQELDMCEQTLISDDTLCNTPLFIMDKL